VTLDDDAGASLRGEDEGGDMDIRRCRSSASVSVLVESDASLAAFGVVIVADRDEKRVYVYRIRLSSNAGVSALLCTNSPCCVAASKYLSL
jgi:hypothetical protein